MTGGCGYSCHVTYRLPCTLSRMTFPSVLDLNGYVNEEVRYLTMSNNN